jgi:rare lipoprotein A
MPVLIPRGLILFVVASASFTWNVHAGAQTKSKVGDRAMAGLASVYDHSSGGKTASGERLQEDALTAAHPSLPFGTVVRVKNVKNGRTANVRINDRGPFVRGRVIDVTPAAAQRLGFSGIAEVSLAVVHDND